MGIFGGARTDLYDAGIDPFLYYTNIISGNPIGGNRQGVTYVDDFYFGVNLYLDKLISWPDAKVTISGVIANGRGLTEHYVGSRFDVQQTVGGQNIFSLSGLSRTTVLARQSIPQDRPVRRIGRFQWVETLTAIISTTASTADIRNVLFDTQFSLIRSDLAARLLVEPTPETTAQVGIFQNWKDIFDRTHNGLNWGIRESDGVFLIAQFGWSPEFGNN